MSNYISRWLIGLSLLWTGAGCSREPEPTSGVDFHRDVAPIFKTRCLHCHGGLQQQGGLRLDDKIFAFQGGLSGKKLVGGSAAESELFRRITSDDPALAMPKEGGRLSAQEIEILRRWINTGAQWPEKTPPSGRDEFLGRYGDDLWKRLGVFGGEPKVFLLLLFAICVGIADRLRRISVTDGPWSHGIRRRVHRLCQHVSVSGFLSVVLGVVLWDLVGFSMRQSSELAVKEQRLAESLGTGDARPRALTGGQPMPMRPRGATGLGGTYYRGNDERHEKLFNGGYYRTATMRLTLMDGNDQPVVLGQSVLGLQLFVRLEIERASKAAPSLFTDALMKEVTLTRRTADRKEPFPSDEPVKLQIVQSGDRWAATYRLGDYIGQSEIALNGVVYVYTSPNRLGEAVSGSQQYGIVYALRVRDGVLQENSEVWLGPILVPGNFQYPVADRITLAEWLDTNPIPEITSDNTSDPKLLGIPEHVEKGAKLPEK